MTDFVIEPGRPGDYDALLALNEAAVPHVNSISAATLGRLHDQSTCLTVVRVRGPGPGAVPDRTSVKVPDAGDLTGEMAGEMAGFLLALPESADYDSLNFRYFRGHYPRFTYIDRVVIGAAWRRAGIGQAIYQDLFARLPADRPLVCCEVNVRPPNPGSLAFHRRMGFSPVGEQDTEGGSKRVSLLIRQPAGTDDP